MNPDSSNPQTEARWKTYAKAAIAVVPAIAACLMARTFILPKVQQIWAEAGLRMEAPMIVSVRILQNVGPALLVAAIAFGLVEWRWRGGARFRGALTNAAVFLLNAAAFFGITAMCVAAVLAAPNMQKAVRSGGAERGAGFQPAIPLETDGKIMLGKIGQSHSTLTSDSFASR
jgi:hypothetical protein